MSKTAVYSDGSRRVHHPPLLLFSNIALMFASITNPYGSITRPIITTFPALNDTTLCDAGGAGIAAQEIAKYMLSKEPKMLKQAMA